MEEEGAEELLKSNGEELSTEEFATQTSHKDDNEEYDEEPEKAELPPNCCRSSSMQQKLPNKLL